MCIRDRALSDKMGWELDEDEEIPQTPAEFVEYFQEVLEENSVDVYKRQDDYGNVIEMGYKSEIIGVTLKDNPCLLYTSHINNCLIRSLIF